MRRYVIIGTGAVGGVIGGNLARSGVPVVWVARGEHGRVLASEGMTLHTPSGTYRPKAPVWASPAEASLTADDVLVLAVKTQSASAALAEWADVELDDGRRAGEALPLLCCTNGVATEDLAARYFARVFGVCVWCPSTFLAPGEIAVRFGPNNAQLHIGRVPAALATPDDRALLEEVAEQWRASIMEVHLPDDVLPWKARKLVTNMMNIVDALLGPLPDAADRERKRLIVGVLEAEAYAVARLAGVAMISDEEESAVRESGSGPADPVAGYDKRTMGASSTWQSLNKGDSLETDYLNGEVVRWAHLAAVPAPANAAVCSLARRAVRQGWRPGHISATQLADALGVDLP